MTVSENQIAPETVSGSDVSSADVSGANIYNVYLAESSTNTPVDYTPALTQLHKDCQYINAFLLFLVLGTVLMPYVRRLGKYLQGKTDDVNI